MLARAFKNLVSTQERITEAHAERARGLLVADGVCSLGMGALLGGPFLAAFALALGAGHYDIGLLAAIGFISQPVQLVGLYLLRSFPKRRAITVVCAGIARLLWIPIILIPLLFVDKGKSFLLQWLLVSALIAAIPGPAWNAWVHELVPAGKLGHLFSRRMFWGTTVALPLTLVGGAFIDWWTTAYPDAALHGYSLVFLLGLLFGVAGVYAIFRTPEPPMAAAARPDENLLATLREPLRDPNFRRLLIFLGSWNFVINMVTPFYVVYMRERIGLSMSWISVLTVVSQLALLASLRPWGRLADRYPNKSILATAVPVLLVCVIAWDFTTLPERYWLTLPLLVAIHLFSGIAMAGIALATNNISLKLSPAGAAHTYMTVLGLVVALTGSVAPLVGGLIADVFAARELSVSIDWAAPGQHLSVYAIDLKALDFLFLFAFLAGIFSLTRLKHVTEAGEVTEREVLDELIDQIVLPFKSISSVEEVRRVMSLPLVVARGALRPGRRARPP